MELTRPDGSPLRVLVVDDEVNIAELIAMVRSKGRKLGIFPKEPAKAETSSSKSETVADAAPSVSLARSVIRSHPCIYFSLIATGDCRITMRGEAGIRLSSTVAISCRCSAVRSRPSGARTSTRPTG